MWNVFVPGVVLVLAFFLIMGCYPFFEQWAADDTCPHQVLDRPRNMPARTAIGAAVLAMAADLQLAGGDDVIAFHLNMPVEDLVWAFRAGFFVLPAVAFMVTRRACIALQRRDRRRLRQGIEFGITAVREGSAYAAVARPASGEERAVMEARRPDELFMPIPRHLVPLPTPRRALAQLRARVNHFYVLSRLETPSAGPPPGMDGAGQPGRPARRRERSRIRNGRPRHHALRAGEKDWVTTPWSGCSRARPTSRP